MSDNMVPWIRSGTGDTPADGGCIMQVIDWIHRNQWTDDPPCVHPVFRRLAITLNDWLDDEGRQKLLDLAPRLMDTASNDKVLSVRLAVFSARHVLHAFEELFPEDKRPRKAIEAAEEWVKNPSAVYAAYAAADDAYAAYAAADDAADAAYAAVYAANAAANAAYAAVYAANAAVYAAYAANATTAAGGGFDFLVALLDEHDRITGRSTSPPLDYSGVCAVMNREPVPSVS